MFTKLFLNIIIHCDRVGGSPKDISWISHVVWGPRGQKLPSISICVLGLFWSRGQVTSGVNFGLWSWWSVKMNKCKIAPKPTSKIKLPSISDIWGLLIYVDLWRNCIYKEGWKDYSWWLLMIIDDNWLTTLVVKLLLWLKWLTNLHLEILWI